MEPDKGVMDALNGLVIENAKDDGQDDGEEEGEEDSPEGEEDSPEGEEDTVEEVVEYTDEDPELGSGKGQFLQLLVSSYTLLGRERGAQILARCASFSRKGALLENRDLTLKA